MYDTGSRIIGNAFRPSRLHLRRERMVSARLICEHDTLPAWTTEFAPKATVCSRAEYQGSKRHFNRLYFSAGNPSPACDCAIARHKCGVFAFGGSKTQAGWEGGFSGSGLSGLQRLNK